MQEDIAANKVCVGICDIWGVRREGVCQLYASLL